MKGINGQISWNAFASGRTLDVLLPLLRLRFLAPGGAGAFSVGIPTYFTGIKPV